MVAFGGCRVGYDVASTSSDATGAAAGEAGSPAQEGGTSAGGDAGSGAIGGTAPGGTSGSGGDSQSQGGSSINDGGMAGTGAEGGAAANGGTSNGGTSNGGTSNGGTSNGGTSNGGTSNGGTSGGTSGGGTSGGAAGGGATAGSGGSGGILAECSASDAYVICPSGTTHDVASANCASMGLRIIRIDSTAENDWLFATMPNSWIGASDAAVEGEWRWDDGTLFWLGDDTGSAQGGLYSNWEFNSPNSSPKAADCAKMNTSGAWVAVLCASTYPYACETY